jgi:hypothetical protein
LPGACFAGSHFPGPPAFAPPAPRSFARCCARASSLVWRSLTFHLPPAAAKHSERIGIRTKPTVLCSGSHELPARKLQACTDLYRSGGVICTSGFNQLRSTSHKEVRVHCCHAECRHDWAFQRQFAGPPTGLHAHGIAALSEKGFHYRCDCVSFEPCRFRGCDLLSWGGTH